MKKNLDIFVIANKFCQFLGPSSYQGCIAYQPKRYKSKVNCICAKKESVNSVDVS